MVNIKPANTQSPSEVLLPLSSAHSPPMSFLWKSLLSKINYSPVNTFPFKTASEWSPLQFSMPSPFCLVRHVELMLHWPGYRPASPQKSDLASPPSLLSAWELTGNTLINWGPQVLRPVPSPQQCAVSFCKWKGYTESQIWPHELKSRTNNFSLRPGLGPHFSALFQIQSF